MNMGSVTYQIYQFSCWIVVLEYNQYPFQWTRCWVDWKFTLNKFLSIIYTCLLVKFCEVDIELIKHIRWIGAFEYNIYRFVDEIDVELNEHSCSCWLSVLVVELTECSSDRDLWLWDSAGLGHPSSHHKVDRVLQWSWFVIVRFCWSRSS